MSYRAVTQFISETSLLLSFTEEITEVWKSQVALEVQLSGGLLNMGVGA